MTFRPEHMKFGIFMAPLHHRFGENPTVAFERDLELIEQLDRLGYDEAWIGEHHSGGVEIFADPAILIAAAAQRTRRIMLGTGVVDLPLHHPYMVADRMVMLDHLTRGRAMLGAGTGALVADFRMLGIDYMDRGRRTQQSLDAIMALLRAEAPVTVQTDWFALSEARLQLASYTKPHLPVAVAGAGSEDGSSMSGRYGIGLLTAARDAESVRATWAWVEAAAAASGRIAHRADWRVTKFFHLAESREEALNDVRTGALQFTGLGLLGVTRDGTNDDTLVEQIVERDGGIIGTPDDAITAIEELLEVSGGFGGFLGALFGLPNRETMSRSYDLFARYVAPHFQGQYQTMKANRAWVVATGGGPGGRGPYGGRPAGAGFTAHG